LGFSADPFTWKIGRLRERLDRAVANNAWSTMFPDARLEHLNYCKSDRRALLLDTKFQPGLNKQKGGPRRFEAKWLQEKTFRDVVQRAWSEAEST
jgi:hypothetical protein